MPAREVRVEDRDDIRRITLARGDTRNLLTEPMMAAIGEALDCDAKVIVIAAEGPSFCAGHDMKGMARHHGDADGGEAAFTALFSDCSAMMRTIADAPQPVIAEVHAAAVAAGCQLVAACDLAVASSAARFGTTGVRFGLYCSTPAVPLTRAVMPKHAAELLMTGALVDADHAARIGLVNRVVAPDRLQDETMTLAREIAAHSRDVLALGKRAAHEQAALPLEAAYERASAAMVENLLLADGREGLDAFKDKRAPVWSRR